MYATTTKIETHDGHRYAVVRTADGREIRRSACDGIGLPDGTVLEAHSLSPPLNWAVGKTVEAISQPWEREVLIEFSDGSRLRIDAYCCGEIGCEWETGDR